MGYHVLDLSGDVQVWFGLSNYTLFGTYLEGRLRSHPLLLQLGDDGLPFSGSGAEARMLDLDISFQELAEVEGAQMYKAADWRCVLSVASLLRL